MSSSSRSKVIIARAGCRRTLATALPFCLWLSPLAILAPPAAAQLIPAVVISEFRTRGPGGANDEFIELYNNTDGDVNIGRWKINGSNASGTITTRLTVASQTMLPARGHFLATKSGTYSGKVAGDQTYGLGLADGGGLALLTSTNVVVDQIGLGAKSAYKEGATLSPLTANANRSYERMHGGTRDTGDNATDFSLVSPSDPQNLGKDLRIIPIHDIQGGGGISPFAGATVTTTGVVTGRKSNGFFIQTPDADTDADASTSQGIFVFTAERPPAAVADFGNLVNITGRVIEFRPWADPFSPSLTQISGSPAAITIISTGNALPAPVTLSAADTNPAGSIEQLERYEGMRVRVAALTAVSPTGGFINEARATATSNGIFYGVITGLARPLREPGIELPDALPAGAPAGVPRFDGNPERLRVDSDAQPGAVALNVTTNASVTNLTGPLDYGFRSYTILPDPATVTPPGPEVSGLASAVNVPTPAGNELTIGSFNFERFFDTVNAPGVDDAVLKPLAFSQRLNKASLAVRHVLQTPDVLGVIEFENLSALQAVAEKINADAIAAGHADPGYQAYLVEGNDIGGIDVGFLVKSARVSVIDVVQAGKDATYLNPETNLPEMLHDRPPLVLRASIGSGYGVAVSFTVIVNHLRSLNGVDGDTKNARRVRAKRQAQAEFLARLIQARQIIDPAERIVSIGDYNAFQFNDGLVDVIGTIKGQPTPADQVALASADLVNPDLFDAAELAPAGERYSFLFDGNAQTLDHILVSESFRPNLSRFAHARSNADFPEIFRNDALRPERISDHDALVAYFTLGTANVCVGGCRRRKPLRIKLPPPDPHLPWPGNDF
ncbi:MAG: lamin tail domain-containing protein [Pyrinomonadaceae bacterium]